ncbi:hypothetical protein VSS37_03390 [Candidatus Thiothrix sp. Deng01]|uniref:Uncharacterized protein n=1 Tax=Candidatus Thiothrix phosphatis TaxID=3112415 RepID=A0ABU6CV58_9GAMM|nr:hypothetical protein [Candidatus Thiothrix sp. Deng01]MEB4590014.1 hypothetical protein [Candidatus Thiothrix sp. Deng01]
MTEINEPCIGMNTAKAKAPAILHLSGVRYVRANSLQDGSKPELQKLYGALEELRYSGSHDFTVDAVNDLLDEMLATTASLIIDTRKSDFQEARNAGWK